jgi:hypothetical protein
MQDENPVKFVEITEIRGCQETYRSAWLAASEIHATIESKPVNLFHRESY